MWPICDITLTLNSKSKNKNKISLLFLTLTSYYQSKYSVEDYLDEF